MTKRNKKEKSNSSSSQSDSSDSSSDSFTSSSSSSSLSSSSSDKKRKNKKSKNKKMKNENKDKKEKEDKKYKLKKKKKDKDKTKKKGCVNVRIITPEEILCKNREQERFVNPRMKDCQDLRQLLEKKEYTHEDKIKEKEEDINRLKDNERIWNSLFVKSFVSKRTFDNKLSNSVAIHKKRILRYLENKRRNFKRGDKSVAYPRLKNRK